MLSIPSRAAEFRQAFGQKRWITDGAMATMLFSRGASAHKPVEELNLTLAPLVRNVHRDYLEAGAEILRTNTFGANRVRLDLADLAGKLGAINRAAVLIAKEAAKDGAFVAGCIGPTGLTMAPIGGLTEEEARSIFHQQAVALAGVDLFILETFQSIAELRAAVAGVREAAGDEPVILAYMSVAHEGHLADGTPTLLLAETLKDLSVDAIGINCSNGPRSVRLALQTMPAGNPHDKPLAASPSAGVGHVVSPEYFARQFVPVHVAGGCCGTTPDHIRALRAAANAWPAESDDASVQFDITSSRVSTEPAAQPSRLAVKLAAGEFVTITEAPIEAAIPGLLESTDAIGIASNATPSSLAAAQAVIAQGVTGQGLIGQELEPLLYVRSRGFSAIQLQNHLLAAHQAGIRNLLCVTGEGVGSRDIQSHGLVHIAAELNQGRDIGGNELGFKTAFLIGVAANPGATDIDRKAARFQAKVRAGAQFAVTMPIFDVERFKNFLARVSECNIPIIAAVRVIGNARVADYTVNELGIPIPDAALERIAAGEGESVAKELAATLRPLAQGLHVTFS